MARVLRVVNAPSSPPGDAPAVFLSGPLGKWRAELIDLVRNDVEILNPVRPDWDSTWRSDTSDDRFVKQSQWEVDHICQSDVVIVYLPAGAQAPITMIELGLRLGVRPRDTIVVCEDGFFKKGYVDVLVAHMGARSANTLREAAAMLGPVLANRLITQL